MAAIAKFVKDHNSLLAICRLSYQLKDDNFRKFTVTISFVNDALETCKPRMDVYPNVQLPLVTN